MIPGQGVKGSAKRWGDNISGCKDQDWDPLPISGTPGDREPQHCQISPLQGIQQRQ